jgi:hypothetical protein
VIKNTLFPARGIGELPKNLKGVKRRSLERLFLFLSNTASGGIY